MAQPLSQYGWIPDLPDQRDYIYSAPRPLLKKLPSKVDLTKSCPPVYDQGELGSCTANAIGAAFEFGLKLQDEKMDFKPSRLFIYYNGRIPIHTEKSDSGASLKDGIKSVNKQGVCPEKLWPYRVTRFTERPPKPCYKEALRHQVLSYSRVPRTVAQMRACLADGFPFVFGFTAYESFVSPAVSKSGILKMPKKTEKQVGGHAVMAVGYNHSAKVFILRNSWGPTWGKKGYFTMPYEYLMKENLSNDFWTMRIIEMNKV